MLFIYSEIYDNGQVDSSQEKHNAAPQNPVLSLFPSFFLPNVLCNPTDLIWKKKGPHLRRWLVT